MQVFLIPIGPDRYEPYYEPVEGDDAPRPDEAGWFARQRRRMSDMLREAEAERHRKHEGSAAPAATTFGARFKRRTMAWIVERAAEQRLLWHLRTADAATLWAPDDLPADSALEILRAGLRKDADRHFRWFVVNLVALILSGILFFIPGPNLVGYYFTFTTVGHLLSWRGAARGDRQVTWQVTTTPALTGLRDAIRQPSAEQRSRVHAVAETLGLEHLATFVERLAIPPA